MPGNRGNASAIWQHFTRDEGKGRCRYCQNLIAMSDGSTGNLRRHLKLKHPKVSIEQQDRGSRSSSPSSSTTGDKSVEDTACQSILSDILDTCFSESNVESQTITDSAVSKNGRATSAVWRHFVREDGKAKCRYCQKATVMASASTGNLKRHLRLKHPTVSVEREDTGRSFNLDSDSTPVSSESNEESQSITESAVSGNQGAASAVWHHFVRNDGKARCRYCQKVIAMSGGSTGNLRRHLKRKHSMVSFEPRDGESRSPSPSATCDESSRGAAYEIFLLDALDSDSAPASSESNVDSQTITGEFAKESLRDSCRKTKTYTLALAQDRPTQQGRVSSRKSPASLRMQPPQPQKKPKSPTDVDEVMCFSESKGRQELDGISHMFLCYEETFRKFHPRTQSMLKVELAKLFANTEMNELHMQVAPALSPMYSHNSGPHDSKINHDIVLSSIVASSLQSADPPLVLSPDGAM